MNTTNLKHTRNYLFGSVGVKSLGFLAVPFFTRHMTIDEFGLQSLYLAVFSFMSTIVSFGTPGSFKRYYYEDANDFGEFLFTNLMMLAFIDVILGVVLYMYSEEIAIFLKIPKKVLMYAYITSLLYLLYKVHIDILQVEENSQKNAVLEFIKTFTILLVAIVFVIMLSDNKYLGRIYGEFIVFGVLSVYSLREISKKLRYKFSVEHIIYSLSFGLPLLPSMFSSFGLAFADRLMINNMLNATEAGIYSFAYTIAMLIQVVVLAMSKSWQPVFYKALKDKKYESLNKEFLQNTKIVLSVSLLVILFTKEAVLMLAGERYLLSVNLVMYLVIGFNMFYLYTVYGLYTTYAKKTYYNSMFSLIAVIVNVGLNYIFIPIYGYFASAITTFVSYALLFIMFYLNAKHYLGFKVVRLTVGVKIHFIYLTAIVLYLVLDKFSCNSVSSVLVKACVYFVFMLIVYKDHVKRVVCRIC